MRVLSQLIPLFLFVLHYFRAKLPASKVDTGDSVSLSWSRRILNLDSKTSRRQVRGICEERLVDRSEGEFGTILCQQHFTGARADNAVARQPRQTERAKEVSALGILFKARQGDVKQGVIWEGN